MAVPSIVPGNDGTEQERHGSFSLGGRERRIRHSGTRPCEAPVDGVPPAQPTCDMARMPVPARCPAERLKANTFLIQLLREAGNIGTIAMRMAAGLAGIAVFGSTTYVVAFSMFCIALNLLQIHSISQSTFMVAVHVAMLVAAISARFGWKLFRQDAFIDRIQTAWSGITGARASRLNG